MIRETSERSRSYNKAELAVHKISDFIHLEFEGISTKENKLTCLLDRGLVTEPLSAYISSGAYIKELKESETHLGLKLGIARRLKIPWLFVVYSYIENKCIVLDLNAKKSYSFSSFVVFGDWFSKKYTDNSKFFSGYEESGLPQFDYALRKNGTP